MVLELAGIAFLIAGLPLAFLYFKKGMGLFQKLNWTIVFLTFDLILFGAFTRLSDSGLGCPDWPGCYGTSNPFRAIEEIRAAEAAMPTGPVTVFKAWVEMIHRYLAMSVGFLIIIQVIAAFKQPNPRRSLAIRGSLFLLVLVCLQGAFGAWTVTLKLQPMIVSMHLILALVQPCLPSCFFFRIWSRNNVKPCILLIVGFLNIDFNRPTITHNPN
ncbi:MAG: heme A synthase [Burkholderiaceae bacterium]|nr:heme A synthase [Burkholderiaceae bacterium]